MKELSQKPDYEMMWNIECELNKELQEQNKKLLSLVYRAYDFVEDGDFHHEIRKDWCKEATEEIIKLRDK